MRFRTLAVVWGLIVLAVISGCGRPSSKVPGTDPVQSQAEISTSASNFKVWVSQGKTAAATSPEELLEMHPPFIRGSALEFDDTIPVRTPGPTAQPLFLEWGGEFHGVPILESHFSTQKKDRQNGLTRDTSRRNARRSDTGGWFVPFVDIVAGEPLPELDPADLYWLDLELTLKDGRQITYQIGLRLQGPLPLVQMRFLRPPGADLSVPIVGTSWAHGGEVSALAVEQINNTSARRLKIWIRASETPVYLETFLSLTQFRDIGQGDGSGRIVPADPTWYRSVIAVQVRGLGILTQVAAKKDYREVTLDDLWSGIDLPAKSEVTLSWLPSGPGAMPRCSIPQEQVTRFKWLVPGREECHNESGYLRSRSRVGNDLRVCEDRTEQHSTVRTQSWTVGGVEVSGAIKREILLGERSLAATSAASAAHGGDDLGGVYLTQANLSPERGLFPLVGHHVDSNVPLASCQGIY